TRVSYICMYVCMYVYSSYVNMRTYPRTCLCCMYAYLPRACAHSLPHAQHHQQGLRNVSEERGRVAGGGASACAQTGQSHSRQGGAAHSHLGECRWLLAVGCIELDRPRGAFVTDVALLKGAVFSCAIFNKDLYADYLLG